MNNPNQLRYIIKTILLVICLLSIALLLGWQSGFLASAFHIRSYEGSVATPKIVYISERGNECELRTMDLDGRNRRIISKVKLPGFYAFPRISPNRQEVAYISRDYAKKRTEDIYLINTDGTSRTQVTNNSDIEKDLAFSPDGKKIVYDFIFGYDAAHQVGIIQANGTNFVNLTRWHEGDYADPIFSPDGSRIACIRNRPKVFVGTDELAAEQTKYGIFTISLTGQDSRILVTGNSGDFKTLTHSPDGKKIAFVERKVINNKTTYRICAVDINGNNLVQLFSNQHKIDHLKYSPDGEYVLFEINIPDEKTGYTATNTLYVMKAEGKNPQRIIQDTTINQFDSIFTPDSRKIVFAARLRQDSSRSDICIIDIDGRNFTNLTKDSGGGNQLDVR